MHERGLIYDIGARPHCLHRHRYAARQWAVLRYFDDYQSLFPQGRQMAGFVLIAQPFKQRSRLIIRRSHKRLVEGPSVKRYRMVAAQERVHIAGRKHNLRT
jgi:hypothetical protein